MNSSMDVRRPGSSLAVFVVMVVALSTVLSVPAGAGKKAKKRITREATAQYVGITGPRGVQDYPCISETVGCVRFEVQPEERFVSLDIQDASGDSVWASVYVYGYSDGTDSHEHVCAETSNPLALAGGLDELVVVVTQTTGGVTNSCAGPATQGSITATFSNLP